MPFDYEEYQKKCDSLSTEQLQKEWENYTRQMAGGATSTATSVLFSPFTAGISLIGLGLSAPRIHNARKKREIIEAGLQERGATHETRKRDVIAPMAIAGTLGTVTLGLAGPGADMIAGAAVGHGVEYAVSHAALDSTGAILEHKHDEHHKKKADEKLQVQYQKFQQQYIQEQAAQGVSTQTSPQKPVTTSQDQASGVKSDGSHLPPSLQAGQMTQDHKYEYVSVPPAYANKPPSQLASIAPKAPDSISSPPPAYSPTVAPAGLLKVETTSTQTVVEKPVIIENTTKMECSEDDDMRNHYPANCPSLFPLSSRPSLPQTLVVPLATKAQTTQVPEEQITIAELPANEEVQYKQEVDSDEVVLTMEQEIALLKARILQMELEKRQVSAQRPEPTVNQVQSPIGTSEAASSTQHNRTLGQQYPPLNPMLNAITTLNSDKAESFLPPPPLPPRSPAPPAAVLLPQNSASQHCLSVSSFPPPPPSPRPSMASSGTGPNSASQPVSAYPPPPSPGPSMATSRIGPENVPQPVSYPAPPPPPVNYHQQHPALYNPSEPHLQHQPQNYVQQVAQKPQYPPFERHDSGYYSNPPSRHSSSFTSATLASYNPSQHSLSPQTTANHLVGQEYNPSYSPAQFGPVSPMSPQSQPAYFAPPPSGSNPANPIGVAAAVSGAKDYINNRLSQYLPDIKKYVPATIGSQHPPVAPAQPSNGTQGWQWGMAHPPDGQPDYGPPPPIPHSWRGSA